jgi:transposase
VPAAWRIGQGNWSRVDASAVIWFMNGLVKRLRRRTILVLDNASVHSCKILRTRQAKWRQCGLEFYFLPAYSLELNLIEGLWRQVKYHWYPFSEADAVELGNPHRPDIE